uniref:Uncharacterized protein n=1 Tax=Parascaris equorum TaxID=6256 RepID=A0A914RCZ3_PAREQ
MLPKSKRPPELLQVEEEYKKERLLEEDEECKQITSKEDGDKEADRISIKASS